MADDIADADDLDEHPAKVTAWRDGAFVVHPDAEADDDVVWSYVHDGPVMWEGLRARRLAEDRARLAAIPFWVYDLDLGDEVALETAPTGALIIADVTADAGNHTYRVVFEDAGDDDPRWRELAQALSPLGCWFDVRSPGFLALSAPDDGADAVAAYLHARAARGELTYEAGHTAPPAPDEG
jgi:hypothetical protein